MKKVKYLFLLVPSLFLMTSCQTTPHVDTITEKEAQDFIYTNYKDVVAKAPSTSSTIKWEVKKDNDAGEAKKEIGLYIDGNSVADNKVDKIALTSTDRLNQYANDDLNKDVMGKVGTDAVVAMNPTIYQDLYQSEQRQLGGCNLVYKNGPNNGLVIISQLQSTTSVHTRSHTYNAQGLETEFKVELNKDDLIYTMTINFKYE